MESTERKKVMQWEQVRLLDSVLEEIEKVCTVAATLWQRRWIERNGGNISLNLTAKLTELPESYDSFRYLPGDFPAGAAGMVLFVTGSGKRLRDLSGSVEGVACVARIDEGGNGCHILWGGHNEEGAFQPSSEFIAHVMIHLMKKTATDKHRAVLHVHPQELIALSHHPVIGRDERKLNHACWSMLPEIRLFVPRGIGLVPFMLPGSKDLATATARQLSLRDVVLWSKHGAVATGKDIGEAFDYIDVANKGAEIYLQCLSSGFVPEGMSDREMNGVMRLL